MSKRKPAFFAVLPPWVRYDPKLRPNAKLLYAEITAGCDVTGYCWATNAHFSDVFGIALRTVSDLISTLADGGYLRLDIIRDPKNNEITERRIFINPNPPQWWLEQQKIEVEPEAEDSDTPIAENGHTPIAKNSYTPIAKNSYTPIAKNGYTPIAKNGVYNNPKDILTVPPIVPHGDSAESLPQKPKRQRGPRAAPDWEPERFEAFWKFYPRGENKQGAIRAWDRLKPSPELIDQMAVALVEQKKSKHWQDGIGIPHASTWLNNQRWLDTVTIAPSERHNSPAPSRVVETEEVPDW